MNGALVVLVLLPLAGAAAGLLPGRRLAPAVSVVVALACLALALALIPAVTSGPLQFGFLRADAISVVFVVTATFVYASSAVYAVGYLRGEQHRVDFSAYARRFWVGINLFAWSMVCAPLMDGLALLWIAVEVTTVISALLVALDDTRQAAEAAWKYILIASAGLGVALLATITMYYAGASVLGPSYDLGFRPAARTGTGAAADGGQARVRPRGCRVRYEGRPLPRAHLAAGRALRGTDPGVGDAVGCAAGRQLLRRPAVLPDRRRRAR